MLLALLREWSVDHVKQDRNTILHEIAKNVTSDQSYQSFIATGGPSWLLSRLDIEAQS